MASAANEAVQLTGTAAEMGATITNEPTHPTMPLSLQTAVPHTASSATFPAAINPGNLGEKVDGVVLMSACPST